MTRTSRLWSGILISSTVARLRVILGRGNAVVDVTSRQQVLSMSSVGGRHRYSYKYIVSYVHFPSILPTSPTQDMTANCTKAGRRSTAIADVITYRHEDKMVYVPLDSNWLEALRHAQSAFATLAGIDGKRITFSVNLIKDGQRKSVRISPSAWRSVSSHLARYEIIDIEVNPEIPRLVVTDVDAPPQYSSSALSSHEHSATKCCHCIEEKGNPTVETQRCSRSPSPTLSMGPHSSGKLNPKKMLQKLF